MKAAQGGHLAVMRFLVSEGADIHVRDENGWTALMWAAQGGHLDVVRFLVVEGADIHARNNVGDTALVLAAQGGHLALVRFLVSEGADIHVRDENGWTALMRATVGGHLALVRFLVSEGVDVNARNESGDTALTWAIEGLQLEDREKKKCYEEVVAFLRAAGGCRGGEAYMTKAQAVFTRLGLFCKRWECCRPALSVLVEAVLAPRQQNFLPIVFSINYSIIGCGGRPIFKQCKLEIFPGIVPACHLLTPAIPCFHRDQN